MKSLIYALFVFPLVSCGLPKDKHHIIAVNGLLSRNDLGTTLIHEHILVDWIGADSTGYHRWNRDSIVQRALPFLKEAKSRGLHTFFDCTPAYLGRDPILLKRLSDSAGINIVTNTGYYGARSNLHIPEEAFHMTANEMARVWIEEFEKGIDDTGIRPGFIKISVEGDSLSELHTKLIQAAAITHIETGLTIVSHTGPDHLAFEQMEVLEKEGVNLNNFVWTHAQNGTREGHLAAASKGVWISLDNVSSDSTRIAWYVDQLATFKQKNILDRVLLSHDSGWYNVGQINGGKYNGYTAIFDQLIPTMFKHGFDENDIELIFKENPKEAFTLD